MSSLEQVLEKCYPLDQVYWKNKKKNKKGKPAPFCIHWNM